MIRTDYLVAKNSFFSGMGRVLDLFATRQNTSYNISDTPTEADYKAIYNDWAMVGQDMKKVINYERKKISR